MSKVYKIKKGLDIKLKGAAERIVKEVAPASNYALKPTDFPGLIPKLHVKVGDQVKAGTPLFFDKYAPEVLFTSPVSGTVIAINRGERRRILEVIVEKEGEEYVEFNVGSLDELDEAKIKEALLQSGVWPSIKQRPYDIVADPTETPKAIYISAFDTAPLALDLDFVVERDKENLQKGLDVLAKLAPVHLNIHKTTRLDALINAKNVEVNTFSGVHPASNVGVQIHKIAPVNKGDVVWTLDIQDVIILGRLFSTGKYDARKLVAVGGSEVRTPVYCSVIRGSQISNLIASNLKDDEPIRVISGTILTGEKIEEDGYLGFYSSQVIVIPEGEESEFLGWALPGFGKLSASRTYFSWLTPKKEYRPNANIHGEERAFVFTGQYEKVFPMDIYPVYLLKAILAKDIDKMEQLGIYEVAPEDFALCEFVCTSKIDSQKIVREGLDYLREELS